MKSIPILFLALIAYLPPTLTPKNIAGKYGTAGEEFICLELHEDQYFALTISSCSADNFVEGKYTIEGENISLTSTVQPAMKLQQKKASPAEQYSLNISSNERMLLPRIQIALDDAPKKYRLNKNGELALPSQAKKVSVHYDQLPPATIILQGDGPQAYELDLQFENLAAASIKEQLWAYSKKKLTYIDENGNKVVLRKTAQCWFDYMEN